jgi:hypothetical protein
MPELPDLADRTPICVLRRWMQDIEWANFFGSDCQSFPRQNSHDAVSRWQMNCLILLSKHAFISRHPRSRQRRLILFSLNVSHLFP